ncbi:MAG: hypothetical protein PWQ97_629 [Tepidanaerobacteraceae bacterium]|nr:hypothetical protein [Tepidanaerobacteraceae bacterium]
MADNIRVHFPNQGKTVLIDDGATIAAACARAGLYLDLVCGGRGKCGKCKVDIVKDGQTATVLACQEKVSDGLSVLLKDEQISKKANILTDSNLADVDFEPAVKKVFIKKEALATPLCGGDWESIAQSLDFQVHTPSLQLLQKLSCTVHRQDIAGITLTFWGHDLIDVDDNDTVGDLYGFAIDVGTTTVAAYLYNLCTGKRLGVYSALNGQVSEGADVISRIVACVNNPDGSARLQERIIYTINQLIQQAASEQNIDKNDIYYIALCGNSAMQHLFLGLYPEHLGKYPFTSTVKSDVVTRAEQLNLCVNPYAVVHFLPLIGGFVGADTIAVLLSLSEDELDEHRLIMDLGTNGEIVVGNRDKMLAASTAAGPALEGAGIRFGMRGTAGAIERVSLSGGNINLKVIGNTKPMGICGSGLIDAVAEMLRAGIIDENGKMKSRDEYVQSCLPEYRNLAGRLEKISGINCFVLADESQSQSGEKIYVSQKDIRAVQLAKAAIYTGCMLLMQEYGLSPENLKEILIAGAFGNYIDIANGQYIGLIPSFDSVPTRSIGNAAGAGVQRFMLSKKIREKAGELQKRVVHVELASNPHFQQEYFKNLNFFRNK